MKHSIFSTMICLFFFTALCALPVAAQSKAPAQVPGEVVYIAYPVAIAIDGTLDDWAGIPVQNVITGPKKSPLSTQNRSFDVSVAADDTNLYIYMHSVDAKIIAGKHGKDFWNEDSMEFYFNLSGNLATPKYIPGIFQININGTNIGKKNGDVLSITGTNSETVKVNGAVFKTTDGWAFEAAIPLGSFKPEHGKTIGFQAQANGATELNRDSQLIWSKLDKNNASYQNPAVFGKAVFFKVGSTDVPVAK